MSKSSRHHYIPIWFQKRFSADGFFVYDKVKGQFIKQKRYPKSLFFEYDRNSVDRGNVEPDILEAAVFQLVDDRFCMEIGQILNGAETRPITAYEIETVLAFISSLRLRNPASDVQISDLFSRYDFDELGYNMVDKESGERISKDEFPFVHDMLFNKAQQVIAMFAPLLRSPTGRQQLVEHTKLVRADNGAALLTDRPIVFRSDVLPVNELQDFCVSMSNTWHVLNRADFQKVTNITFVVKDIIQFKKAHRYVACAEKEYLLKIVSGANDEMYDLRSLNNILFGEVREDGEVGS